MKRLLVSYAAAMMLIAVPIGSAAADPSNFGTFSIDCGAHGTFEIVAKPGMSQVVLANGEPSTSVALLLDFEGMVDGEPIVFQGRQYRPPGIRRSANEARLVECDDPSFEAPDFFHAWVLFTPASG
jgi:hypothetical protein